MNAGEKLPSNEGSFSERLKDANRAYGQMLRMAGPQQRIAVNIGETNIKVPFSANIDGEPQEVLALVSIGDAMQPSPHNLESDIVTRAKQTFVVARHSSDGLKVASITPDEARTGRCDIKTAPDETGLQRVIAAVPQEGKLSLPVAMDPYAQSSDVRFSIDAGRQQIVIDTQGYPAFAIVASGI